MAGRLVLMYSPSTRRVEAETAARRFLYDFIHKDEEQAKPNLSDIRIRDKSPEQFNGSMVSAYDIVDPVDFDVLVCADDDYHDVFIDGSQFAWDTLHYGVGQGEKLVPPEGMYPARDEMMRALLRILDPNVTQDLNKHVHHSCEAWVLRDLPCT